MSRQSNFKVNVRDIPEPWLKSTIQDRRIIAMLRRVDVNRSATRRRIESNDACLTRDAYQRKVFLDVKSLNDGRSFSILVLV